MLQKMTATITGTSGQKVGTLPHITCLCDKRVFSGGQKKSDLGHGRLVQTRGGSRAGNGEMGSALERS